jgi:[protein-PII] uridylyltransferase
MGCGQSLCAPKPSGIPTGGLIGFNGDVTTAEPASSPKPSFDRAGLLADPLLHGSEFTATYTAHLDAFIHSFVAEMGIPEGRALVAVGGYGRAEMAPESDLDIVLIRGKGDHSEFAGQVWYPIWDAGLRLGQSTNSVQGLLDLAAEDLDTATSLLHVRHLAGDRSLSHELALEAGRAWRADPQTSVTRLAERMRDLREENGEVAFSLAPDLKLGRGGLRDVHALGWVAAAGVLADTSSLNELAEPFETLTRARVGLHRVQGRAGNRLVLDYQDEVARSIGYHDADVLMTEVSSAARSIAWVSDATWFWVERSLQKRRRASDHQVFDGDILLDGLLMSLDPSSDIAGDPTASLRVAVEAARHRAFIEHDTLRRLAMEIGELPDPWTREMRDLFVTLLLLGRPAIAAIEALDQVGLMTALVPEWEPCRSKPQRNAYHRFTVDRHLLEAAAEAASLADRVGRPDLLVLGALLHDIGKGYPGDHTEVGVELIPRIATRMGFDEGDTDLLTAMCAQHLLLPDVATRRDLDDDGTIRFVAETVETTELLELLRALTVADSIATGPSAWSTSKADLVHTLADRTRHVLEGGEIDEVVVDRFPTEAHLALIARGEFSVSLVENTITVVATDRDGVVSRAAGVLALNGLDIVSASAHTESGMALSEFVVRSVDEVDFARLESQLLSASRWELALDARVDDRRRVYSHKPKSAVPVTNDVSFDNTTSDTATVIEVSALDEVGLLYRVSRALADVGVAIATARIQTIGDKAVDTFYVRHSDEKILDSGHLAEIERAVLHAIDRQ